MKMNVNLRRTSQKKQKLMTVGFLSFRRPVSCSVLQFDFQCHLPKLIFQLSDCGSHYATGNLSGSCVMCSVVSFCLCILNERLCVCLCESVGETAGLPFMRLWCVCAHL